MDIVVICNGLGNQMSQYAFYLKKKSLNKSTKFIFDRKSWFDHNGFELDKIFNISYQETLFNRFLYFVFRILGIKKIPLLSKPILKLLNILGISLTIENQNYDYNENLLLSSKGLMFYYGGWHSEKYFHSNAAQILSTFEFRIDEKDENIGRTLKLINKTNSVSIHIRRGDYMNDIHYETFGSVCTKQYFEMAIAKINSLVENPHYFIFSNDITWVKDNLKITNMSIIDFNKGSDSWKDMYLISQCKYNINSNSTFSWWGAWLNTNSDKIVIVPKFYINNLVTKDIYPSSWIQLEEY